MCVNKIESESGIMCVKERKKKEREREREKERELLLGKSNILILYPTCTADKEVFVI